MLYSPPHEFLRCKHKLENNPGGSQSDMAVGHIAFVRVLIALDWVAKASFYLKEYKFAILEAAK